MIFIKKYIPVLKKTKLFNGIDERDILSMLPCLQAKKKDFCKGEYIFRQGEKTDCIAILLDGKLLIQQDDYWGNRSIISDVDRGEMFAEAFAAPDSEAIFNDVVAVEESVVLFLDLKKMLTVCSSACRFHSMVIQNLYLAISQTNRKLMQKLGHISKRTTREKLISYLSYESKKQEKTAFEIPFNRQQLADFLSVDRSAMSNELCKLRDEGMIKFHKNQFELLQKR